MEPLGAEETSIVSNDLERDMVDSWIEGQTLPVHKENLKSAIVEQISDEDSPPNEKLNEAIGRYGDKMVGLTSIGFNKPDGGSLNTISMLDTAVNTDSNPEGWTVDKGLRELVKTLNTIPVTSFTGLPTALKEDLRRGDYKEILTIVGESIKLEDEGVNLGLERKNLLTNILLPVAKYNTSQKITEAVGSKLDERIENAGYL